MDRSESPTTPGVLGVNIQSEVSALIDSHRPAYNDERDAQLMHEWICKQVVAAAEGRAKSVRDTSRALFATDVLAKAKTGEGKALIYESERTSLSVTRSERTTVKGTALIADIKDWLILANLSQSNYEELLAILDKYASKSFTDTYTIDIHRTY